MMKSVVLKRSEMERPPETKAKTRKVCYSEAERWKKGGQRPEKVTPSQHPKESKNPNPSEEEETEALQ